jgi:tryptophan oxidase VioA
MDHTSDICIVGAGITGLSCAIALLKSTDGPNLNIQLYDLNPEVGGRIHSCHLRMGEIVELGAGRFSPQLHPLLTAVFQQHGQSSTPYPFTAPARQTQTQQRLKDILRQLKPELARNGKQPFFEFACRFLGKNQADSLVRALGYDALMLPSISAEIAYDIIEKHPETQGFVERPRRQWQHATQGLGAMVNALRRQAQTGGVQFHLQQRLSTVDSQSGQHLLSFVDVDGDSHQHRCRHLILALPPSAMSRLALDFPLRWSPYRYGSLPLFKAFLSYPHPWWLEFGLSNRMLIVDNPLRKIYFQSDRHVWFYTDSENAAYWRDIQTQGELYFLHTVREHLAQALHLPHKLLPMPQAHRAQYWPQGVEFCQDADPNHPPALIHADRGIIAASDAYTPHCGWMEGGLISGRAAADLLLARMHTVRAPCGDIARPQSEETRVRYEHS